MLQSLGWLKGELKKENLGLPWFTFTYIYIHLHTFTYIYIHLHTFTYIYIHYHTLSYIYIYLHTLSYIIIHLHMCLSSCTGFPVNSPETTAMLRWNSTGQRNQSLSARRWSRKTEVAWQPWGETIFCGPKIEAYASKLR